MKKGVLWIILGILIFIGIIFGIIYFTGGLYEAIGSEWQESIISCNIVQDCNNYLLNNEVSQEDINKIDFKCENKLCYFKGS